MKHKTIGKILLCTLFMSFFAPCMSARNKLKNAALVWETDFELYFDNREYNDVSPYSSCTIFGAEVAPRIGVAVDSVHLIMAGFQVQRQMGGGYADWLSGLSLYYNYSTPKHKFYAGIFPREKMSGKYSRAFFSDSTVFFTPVTQGVLYQFESNSHGWDMNVEAGIDWMGKYGDNSRERFMIFSAGEFSKGVFSLGYNAYMYHFSVSSQAHGVVDNFLLYPYVAADFGKILPLDVLSLKVGWLQSLQNDRIYNTGYLTPGGVEVTFRAGMYGLYIDNSVYCGQPLMPFYNDKDDAGNMYGSDLYFGDRYYDVQNGFYDRLELGWEPYITDYVSLRIGLVAHFYKQYCGFQQMLGLRVNF